MVATMVVFLSWGEKRSLILARFNSPASFFFCHSGDSGRKGRMMISGMAGIKPLIKVYRQAA